MIPVMLARRVLLGVIAAAPVARCVPTPALAGDAAIPALIRQHRVNTDAVNSFDGPEQSERYERLWEAYSASRDAIIDLKPATIRGVLDKAQVLAFETHDPPIQESICADLVRLNGGAA